MSRRVAWLPVILLLFILFFLGLRDYRFAKSVRIDVRPEPGVLIGDGDSTSKIYVRVIGPDGRPRMGDRLNASIVDGGGFVIVYRTKTNDKGEGWFEFYSYQVNEWDPAGDTTIEIRDESLSNVIKFDAVTRTKIRVEAPPDEED